MNLRFYKEVTEWKTPTPNHIYLLNKSKDRMYAYIQEGTNEPKVFLKPIQFHKKDRVFVDIGPL